MPRQRMRTRRAGSKWSPAVGRDRTWLQDTLCGNWQCSLNGAAAAGTSGGQAAHGVAAAWAEHKPWRARGEGKEGLNAPAENTATRAHARASCMQTASAPPSPALRRKQLQQPLAASVCAYDVCACAELWTPSRSPGRAVKNVLPHLLCATCPLKGQTTHLAGVQASTSGSSQRSGLPADAALRHCRR